jgi:hypothetical protein
MNHSVRILAPIGVSTEVGEDHMSIPAATGLSLAHMGAKVPNIPELANNPRFDLVVIEGLAEALSPSILGFSILCAVWFITAIGERRLSHDGGDLGN